MPIRRATPTALAKWADELGAEAVLCTEKDLVKLATDEIGDRPLWAIRIGLEILPGGKHSKPGWPRSACELLLAGSRTPGYLLAVKLPGVELGTLGFASLPRLTIMVFLALSRTCCFGRRLNCSRSCWKKVVLS